MSDPEVDITLTILTVKVPAPLLFRLNEPVEGVGVTMPLEVVAAQECDVPAVPPATFATMS